MRDTLKPWLYLAFPLLAVGLFFYWPWVQAIHMSLYDYSQSLYSPAYVGLANYTRLLEGGPFWDSLSHTFILLMLVLPGILTLPILLALLVNSTLPGVTVFRTLLYLPVLISMVVVGLTWKWLLASDGLINGWLQALQLPAIPWLTHPTWALLAIAVVTVWKGLGYYMMLYLAQLQSSNPELYQAAALDGAGRFQQHWHLTLPHLRPTMVLVLVIGSIACLKLFTEVYVMTRGGPLGGTETLVYYVYKQAFEQLNLGQACAGGLVLALILFSFSWLQLRVFGSAQRVRP